jgi:uncharacterized protein (TIGR00255 family)
MTGYGQAVRKTNGYQVTVELKSVNHRFLDVNVRLPRRYMLFEERIKELIKQYASRGRFDLNLSIEAENSGVSLKVNRDLALDYYRALRGLAADLNISADFNVFDLAKVPDIFTLEQPEEDREMVWALVQEALTEALQALLVMRQTEGENLRADLSRRNSTLLEWVRELEQRSPEVTRNYQQKLLLRLEDLLAGTEPDPQRLLQETAMFADRSSITEEIVRLKSHIGQFEAMLSQTESIGRKSDFLLQEMFREINTIASKANDLTMNRIAVDVKAELEKLREQIQNIE